MKKPLLIVLIILALIIALPLINLIRWTFQEKRPMDIAIVDKTVPNLERLKHKSLVWILNNERFVKSEKKRSYSFRKDYYGFSPTRPLKERGSITNEYRLSDLIDLPEKVDALYITDTYGVFFNDWWAGINQSRRSRKLYGGLNNTDYLFVNEMKNRDKLVILENNTLDFPTTSFESYRTQEKLGIKYSGWSGRYFQKLDTLSKNFPIWMTAMYRKQYNEPWTFKKAGIVFLTEKQIIVLEEGTHLKNPIPRILTNETNCSRFGVAPSVAYANCFEVIDPLQNNVISSFSIETTDAGDALLQNFMLSNSFPAVTEDPVSQRTYYFAGDFATNKVRFCTSRLKGFHKLKEILYSDKTDDTRRFFWLYYKPLVNTIFTEYYNSLDKD